MEMVDDEMKSESGDSSVPQPPPPGGGTSSPRRSTDFMKRYSVFDNNNKAAHLPAAKLSGSVHKSVRQFRSMHTRNSIAVTGREPSAKAKDYRAASFSARNNELSGAPERQSSTTSVRDRRSIFETRNREILEISSQHVRRPSGYRRGSSIRSVKEGDYDGGRNSQEEEPGTAVKRRNSLGIGGSSHHDIPEEQAPGLGVSLHSALGASFNGSFSVESPRNGRKALAALPSTETMSIASDASVDSGGSFEGEDFAIEDGGNDEEIPAKSWKPKNPVPQKAALNDLNGESKDKIKIKTGSGHKRSNKLMDRISMFENPKAEPIGFLSSKYRNNLVKKRTKKPENESIGDDKSSDSNLTSSTAENTDSKPETDNVEEVNDATPKISLDKAAADNEKKRGKARYRNKSIQMRKELKNEYKKKGSYVMQKNDNVVLAKVEALGDHKPAVYSKDEADKKVILTALRKNFAFEEMEEKDMEKLSAAMEQIKLSKGTEVVKQGDKGDYFYVIGRGEVSYWVDGKKVGSAGNGNSFGELALLYSSPRAASVKIEMEPTTLFRVDEKTFRFMMQSQTQKSEDERKKMLTNIPFLSSLDAADIARLCSVMQPVLFSTGDYIVKKGESGKSFYVLQEGRVRVTEIFVGGTSYEDIDLNQGDYFGEDSLVSDEPRAANVVALTSGAAFSIDREMVQKVLGDFGSLISKAQDRQRLESMKILRDGDLASSDFETLVTLIKDRNYKQNSLIFREKSLVDPALYIVREGSVKIKTCDGKRDENIGVGGAFGQEQLLTDSGDAAKSALKTTAEYTVTTESDCILGVLNLHDCRTVFDTASLGDQIFSGGNANLEKKRADIKELIQTNIKYEDLDQERIIGEGQFGTVWLVRADPHKTNDKAQMIEFAMKAQFRTDPVRKEGAVEAIKREMTVISQLNHPFIIDLVDKYETEDRIMMLTEAVKGGELWSRIHQEDEDGNWTSGMSESDAQFYALVVADTVAYMHRQKFIFRDLKPENVLIDAEGYPTLCDFGFAKYVPDKTHTFCGTPNYLAPEIVLNRGHGAAVDHWALGIVIYEMVTGENPFYFEGQDQMALLQAIVQEAYYPLPKTASPELTTFMDGLLEKDPVQRLGSLAGGEKDILKQDWFSDLDINQVRNKRAKAPYIPDLS